MRITIKVAEQKKSKGLGVPVGLIKWKWKQHQTSQTLPKKDQPLKLSAQTKEHLLVKLQRGQWWLWRSGREWRKGESVNHIKSSGEHRSHYSNRPSAHPTHCMWDGNGSATFKKFRNTKLQMKNCMGKEHIYRKYYTAWEADEDKSAWDQHSDSIQEYTKTHQWRQFQREVVIFIISL